MSDPVLVLAAQRAEIRTLLRRGVGWSRGSLDGQPWWRGRIGQNAVVASVTGEGRRLARSGAQKAIREFRPRFVLGTGVAGALSPGLSCGEVVASSEVALESGRRLEVSEDALRSVLATGVTSALVLTCDRIVADRQEKDALWRGLESPAAAVVDMESFDFAASAVELGVPFLIVRAVSDEASDSLPSWLNECRLPNGAISRARVAARMALRPKDALRLVRLGGRLSQCAERLAAEVEKVLQTSLVAPPRS